MPADDFRATALEHRLMAMRRFLALLLAHLEDGGLIDRDTLEADYWHLADRNEDPRQAKRDMLEIFEMATICCDGWRNQKHTPRGGPAGRET